MSIKQQPNKKLAVVWRDENLVPRTSTTDYGRKGENEAKAIDLAIKATKNRKEATSVFAADSGKKRKQEPVVKEGQAPKNCLP